MSGHIYPYRRVTDELRQAILNGEYPVGDALPMQLELCKIFGVSRFTMRRAIEALKQEGFVRGGQGRPMVVLKASVGPSFAQLADVYSRLDSWLDVDRHAEQCGGPDDCSCGWALVAEGVRQVIRAHATCQGRCSTIRVLAVNLLGDA